PQKSSAPFTPISCRSRPSAIPLRHTPASPSAPLPKLCLWHRHFLPVWLEFGHYPVRITQAGAVQSRVRLLAAFFYARSAIDNSPRRRPFEDRIRGMDQPQLGRKIMLSHLPVCSSTWPLTPLRGASSKPGYRAARLTPWATLYSPFGLGPGSNL